MPFARHMHEAHMRANLIPAACPAEACAAIQSSAAPQCPERRLSLRRSCMPTSFGPGCIAFAVQAHAQGRVSLQKHVSLRRTGMPRRGFPAVGRTACAPTHRSLPCRCIACLPPAAELQRVCSLGTRPLSCAPRCSQDRPAPTLHIRRRRLQVWLRR